MKMKFLLKDIKSEESMESLIKKYNITADVSKEDYILIDESPIGEVLRKFPNRRTGWYKEGTNHRLEGAIRIREFSCVRFFIEFNSSDELLDLLEKLSVKYFFSITPFEDGKDYRTLEIVDIGY